MIESTYINEFANKVKDDVTKVVVNDSIEITSFDLEQVTDNVYEVKFSITSTQTTQIDNIKLKKADDSIVSNNDVDIPISENEIVIRQTITISEVVN